MKRIIFFLLIFAYACTPHPKEKTPKDLNEIPKDAKIATLAGGCFWCIEAAIEEIDGVYEVVSGYTGGHTINPSYSDVSSGKTGHYEAVQVFYNDKKINFSELLHAYWRQIDPTDDTGQFVDKGSQYKTAIFYNNAEEKKLAELSKKEVQKDFEQAIVTEIKKFDVFYPAEDYHQDYYKKRYMSYNIYKKGSGRKSKLKDLWG